MELFNLAKQNFFCLLIVQNNIEIFIYLSTSATCLWELQWFNVYVIFFMVSIFTDLQYCED